MNYNFVEMVSFGKWLLVRRKTLGLTQGDVAKRAGLSVSYVSTLEREQPHSLTGKDIMPDRDKVMALAKAVDGDISEAMALCGYTSPSGVINSKPKTPAEFLDRIAEMGHDLKFEGGRKSLEGLDEDDLQELLDGFMAATQAKIKRKAKSK